MSGYVELRARTAFSFGDGSVRPEALVEHAARLGHDTIGITDTADLGGIVRAVVAGREHGVRVIAGAELHVDGHPLAVLARDETGYRNLAGLVTAARMGEWGEWDKDTNARRRGVPSVTWAQVAAASDGLHLLTGWAAGRLATLVRAGCGDLARATLAAWHEAFPGRLAVEVQLHDTGHEEAALAGALVELAHAARVPWVVAHGPRYVDRTSHLVHDVLVALRHGMTIDQALRAGVLLPNDDWSLRPPAEMRVRWCGNEAGLAESARIAGECAFDLSWMRPPLPRFPSPAGDDDAYLRVRTYEGARTRWGDTLSDAQQHQLEHELAVIRRLGFAGFFLVMWDATRFARSRGILCQGRGSAANSAVAFCLGITAVDPVKHGLLFERFLSEVRVDGQTDAPDIDVDFEHDRREEVLDYMYASYDRPHAAIAAIVQTYRAPNAVQDAMRAFGYPAALAFSISKRLHRLDPADAAIHMERQHAAQAGLDAGAPRVRALLRAIAGFEGVPRLRATHVGGFVLSSAPLGRWLPIEQTTMGRTIVQFDKDDLDAIGVPKFDFLGLGGLALIRRAFDAIEVRTGTRPEMYSLPADDAETYAMISRGETVGTFQIESRAQISSIVHTRPERLYDIVVQVALIRPGPIQARFVHPYTDRRRVREPVTYAHPALVPILERTQGIPIFQEQAMAIAMALGGYTGGEADELRRTMGNIRKEGRLVAALVRLEARMIANGIEPGLTRSLCDDLRSFANYGFPESHAWSFALIAYATAWLKVHHPAEFYLGILNAWPMGFYSPATLIHEARRQGVEVRGPCLAGGDRECTTEPTADPDRPALRVGWRFVRGLGERSLDRLRAARQAGPFTSIRDVVRRARLTRVELTALALSGSFTAWEPDRRRALWEASGALGDVMPLAPARPAIHAPPAMAHDELIAMDYYMSGASIHGHPMQTFRESMRRAGILDSRDLAECDDGRRVTVAGLVVVRQRPQTAKGTIFLLLEDEHGFINVVVYARLVERYEDLIRTAQFLRIRGTVQRHESEVNVVARSFMEVESAALVHHSRDFH